MNNSSTAVQWAKLVAVWTRQTQPQTLNKLSPGTVDFVSRHRSPRNSDDFLVALQNLDCSLALGLFKYVIIWWVLCLFFLIQKLRHLRKGRTIAVGNPRSFPAFIFSLILVWSLSHASHTLQIRLQESFQWIKIFFPPWLNRSLHLNL